MNVETNTADAISAQLPAGKGTHYQHAHFIVQVMEKYRSWLFENKNAKLVVYCRIQQLTAPLPRKKLLLWAGRLLHVFVCDYILC